jgi:hypothetical protein
MAADLSLDHVAAIMPRPPDERIAIVNQLEDP